MTPPPTPGVYRVEVEDLKIEPALTPPHFSRWTGEHWCTVVSGHSIFAATCKYPSNLRIIAWRPV